MYINRVPKKYDFDHFFIVSFVTEVLTVTQITIIFIIL